MDAYDIEMAIRDDVRTDIHGDLYGVERVAEYIASCFEALKAENDKLRAQLGLIVKED